MNIVINWAICRICMNNHSAETMHTSIYEKDNSGNYIFEKISDCSGIEIKENDNLPNLICKKCMVYLNITHKFRTNCKKSDIALRNFLKATAKAQNEILSGCMENIETDDEDINMQSPEFVEVLSEAEYECVSFDNDTEKSTTNIDVLEKPSSDYNDYMEECNELNTTQIDSNKEVIKKPNLTFICHICGNQFKQKSRLNTHLRQHVQEKPFDCEICKKCFGCNFLLTRHMRIHTGQKPYQCQYCHRKFSDQADKVKHERIHTNERPYTCNVCGKSFRLSHILNVHKMIHTGEKPHKCILCGKKFTQRHKLKLHLNTQRHKDDLNNPDMIKMQQELQNLR